MLRAKLAASSAVLALCFTATPVSAQALSEADAAAMREEIRALKQRIEALEGKLSTETATASAPAVATTGQDTAVASSTPSAPPATAQTAAADTSSAVVDWKGGPRTTQDDKWFKPKGRIQADLNYYDAPGGSTDKAAGISSEFRRIRLGAEGAIGGGVGYKLEVELSDNDVELVDTFVSYQNGNWGVKLGNQNNLQSLDELTGDTVGSFMERAAFTDAFNFERRLGASIEYSKGPILAQFGAFTDDINALSNSNDGPNGGDENNSFGLDGRIVYAPRIGSTQLHLGGSLHWRDLGRLGEVGVRYRQRPFVHSVNSRPIGTPQMSVSDELSYGIELAAIHNRWHGAAEYYFMHDNRPGLSNPTFSGGYAELGYFLTKGDTRLYKNGIFTGNKPANPIDKGGMGSLQLNLRYDYLDLNSGDIRGGKQNAVLAALIWSPMQYLRFNLNYGLLMYDGAVALPDGDQNYNANVIGSRFEFDF